MECLKINNVTKVYKGNKKEPDKVVLKDVSFEINEGEFVCLLGPSGCGKTTLLTMIGGFLEPTAGEIYLDGKLIKGPSSERGYVFQNYALFPWMTVKDNIAYGLKFFNKPKEKKEQRIDYLINMARLNGSEKKFPIQLSGGMQQRVAVARALAGYPRVLLLDEPLGAIDFQMRELLQNELDQMVQEANITAVMVTHDVSESVFMSDRVIVLGNNHGHIVSDYKIKLPRRRDRESNEFKKCVAELTTLVRVAFNEDITTIDINEFQKEN